MCNTTKSLLLVPWLFKICGTSIWVLSHFAWFWSYVCYPFMWQLQEIENRFPFGNRRQSTWVVAHLIGAHKRTSPGRWASMNKNASSNKKQSSSRERIKTQGKRCITLTYLKRSLWATVGSDAAFNKFFTDFTPSWSDTDKSVPRAYGTPDDIVGTWMGLVNLKC